jgi:hypothetical protein
MNNNLTPGLACCHSQGRQMTGGERGIVNLGGGLATEMIGGSSAWRVEGGWGDE